MLDEPAPRSAKAERRDWIGLAVLALPCVLYSMDLTVLHLAVPQIAADLKPGSAALLWIVDIYGFMVAGALVTMGTLGDRIGRRRLLLIGAAAFGVTSLLAAFATSAEMLIVARALQGLAAATLAPSTLSLIRNMFHDNRERAFAIGVWIACFSAGAAIGPVVGGLLLAHFWWGSVFLINVPVMLLLLALGPVLLQEFRDPNAGHIDLSAGAAIGPVVGGLLLAHFWWGSVFLINVPVMLLLLALGPVLLQEFRDPNAGHIDLISATQSMVAVLSIIYGMKRTAEIGIGPLSLFAIGFGLLVGTYFFHRQSRLADPLIDVNLFRVRGISAALVTNIVALFVVFGTFLFIAQYLQLVLGMGPLEAGLWTAPTGIVFALGSLMAPYLERNYRPHVVVAGGFLVSAVGFLCLTQLSATDGPWLLFIGMMILCLGVAPTGAITTDIVMAEAPPERAGAASAISETSFEFGGALGIAVLGSIVTAIYRGAMASQTLPGIPAESVEAAKDTLGGAVEVAAQLSGERGPQLLATAREAFVHAFEVTSALSAAGAVGAAILAAALLRNVRQ